MKNSILFFLLLGSVNFYSVQSFCAERVYGDFTAPRFQMGRFALKTSFEHFSTKENFNQRGQVVDILGSSFQTYNLYTGFEWDHSSTHSLNGGILSGHSYSSSTGRVTKKNTDLKGLQLGWSYKFKKPEFLKNLIFDLKYFQRLHSNKFSVDEVSLGDGVNWLMAGFWVGTRGLKFANLLGYGGVKHSFQTSSSNVYFLLQAEGKLESLKVGGGLEGQIPIVKESENQVNRLLFIDRNNAGSFHYFGIDSEYIEAFAWGGLELLPYTILKVGIAKPVSGTNTSSGFRVFANFEMSFSLTNGGYRFPYINLKKAGAKELERSGQKRIKNYAPVKKNSD